MPIFRGATSSKWDKNPSDELYHLNSNYLEVSSIKKT